MHSVALKGDGTVVAWGAGETINSLYGIADSGQSIVPPGLNNVVALAPGSAALDTMVLRRQSDAPVAWLNSDNTFNGNITVNGDTTVSGEMRASDLRLDDGNLWLRGGIDQNNGLGWYSAGPKSFTGSFNNSGPDGPVLFGEGGGALGTSSNNSQQVALVWDSGQHVGIGTTSPGARLDLGNDSVGTKLLIGGGFGIGASNGLFRFHLGSSGGSFTFLDAPNGNQLVTIQSFNGTVGIGTTSPNAKLDVRGQVALGSSGQLYAVGSSSSEFSGLRIVRGQVNYLGTILTGTGFTVAHSATGGYTVTFSPAFSGTPVVVATVQHGTAQMATVSSPSSSVVFIDTWNPDGTASDQYFQFIAIGPQ